MSVGQEGYIIASLTLFHCELQYLAVARDLPGALPYIFRRLLLEPHLGRLPLLIAGGRQESEGGTGASARVPRGTTLVGARVTRAARPHGLSSGSSSWPIPGEPASYRTGGKDVVMSVLRSICRSGRAHVPRVAARQVAATSTPEVLRRKCMSATECPIAGEAERQAIIRDTEELPRWSRRWRTGKR
jgi:hypothetical protein